MLKSAMIFFLFSIVAGFIGFTMLPLLKIFFFLFLLVAVGIIVFGIIAGRDLF